MRSVELFLLFVLFVLASSSAYAFKKADPNQVGMCKSDIQQIDGAMLKYIEEKKLAGISTLVLRNGKIAHLSALGYADIQTGKKLDESSIFRIYSMTKPITSVALMMLWEEGKFKLDDKVSDHIKVFKGLKVHTKKDGKVVLENQKTDMTIRHLFTHTSGLTYGWDAEAEVDALYREKKVLSWDEPLDVLVERLATIPLKHQPGTQWEYGVSIDVLGYLVEVLSGMPLDRFFEERLFKPLKMKDTGFYTPKSKIKRMVTVYGPGESGGIKAIDHPSDSRFSRPAIALSGGGGLVSTIGDYARFGQMLINRGVLDGSRVLKTSTFDLILNDQMPNATAFRKGFGFGLGFQVRLDKPLLEEVGSVGEVSWGGAADTHFWADVKENMVLLAFSQNMPANKIPFTRDFRKRVYQSLKNYPACSESGSGMLGKFDKKKDLLLANFDHKPDADDNHSNAGLATMLRDSRFAGIKYHAVAGAIGKQGGSFVFSAKLYDLAFGAHWSNADANRDAALDAVSAKVLSTVDGGGDLWVMEAGQSDFSADLVRRIKKQRPKLNTNSRIHIVQHSEWNENKTSPLDLAYVKNNTDYNKIPDGNARGNGSPGFNTGNNSSQWGRATSNVQVGSIWQEARKFSDNVNGTTGHNNTSIAAGGMDFSDTSEATWIFGFNAMFDTKVFFDEFL